MLERKDIAPITIVGLLLVMTVSFMSIFPV